MNYQYPMEWVDRGRIRKFDNLRNYPDYKPDIVYLRQVQQFLYQYNRTISIERVLKFPLYGLPDTWMQRDKYGSQYVTIDQADAIVDRFASKNYFNIDLSQAPRVVNEPTREVTILTAIGTYTGKRLKRTKWPWVTLLREHAGIKDITVQERNELSIKFEELT